MKRSKAYRQAMELIDPERLYAPAAAMAIAKQTAKTKFDPTIEVSMRISWMGLASSPLRATLRNSSMVLAIPVPRPPRM